VVATSGGELLRAVAGGVLCVSICDSQFSRRVSRELQWLKDWTIRERRGRRTLAVGSRYQKTGEEYVKKSRKVAVT
jgi:hypothetical protein